MRIHDSQAYRKMDVARERISRILELSCYCPFKSGHLLSLMLCDPHVLSLMLCDPHLLSLMLCNPHLLSLMLCDPYMRALWKIPVVRGYHHTTEKKENLSGVLEDKAQL